LDGVAEAGKHNAVKHDIEPSFAVKRPRRVKCRPSMPGEKSRDERIQDPEKSFKVGLHAYIPALDKLLSQFKDRFTDNTIDIMKEMQYFLQHIYWLLRQI
jgi:hypothetical protein